MRSPKFKIGDSIKAKITIYSWRKPYVGVIGIICKPAQVFDWIVAYDKRTGLEKQVHWYEEDLELYYEPGEQLLFSFMEE